jgi:pimeloyl-ACP methyl ester carboxylesterase
MREAAVRTEASAGKVTKGSAAWTGGDGIDSYRRAERAFWDFYGLAPMERFLDMETPRVRIRVQEVGSGEPIVFIHGTAGASPVWAPLIRELADFRCILIDRPGWAMSSMLDYPRKKYADVVNAVLVGVLNGLGIDRTHAVGASIGDIWALRLAESQPARIEKIVLLGGGPLFSDIGVPGIVRAIASPMGALMVRLPSKPARVRSILRANGDGPSLDAGRLDEFIKWRVALERNTKSMRNERAMVRSIVNWRDASYRPGLMFADEDLGAIQQPVLMVYGTADPVGSVDTWRRFAGLLPGGQLRLVDGAGHLPWFHDPAGVANDVRRWLRGGAPNATSG